MANRLSTIHDASSPCQLRYVDSQSNPADYASRGLSIIETEKFESWLNGPAFFCSVCNLTVGEISHATREIVQVSQAQYFPKELEILSKERSTRSLDSSLSHLSRKRFACVGYLSPLRKLSQFIHNGIICVGGHLERAPIGCDAKHLMILPGKNYVTDLIVKEYHEAEGHLGANQFLSRIRRQFWILQGHSAVRRVVGNV